MTEIKKRLNKTFINPEKRMMHAISNSSSGKDCVITLVCTEIQAPFRAIGINYVNSRLKGNPQMVFASFLTRYTDHWHKVLRLSPRTWNMEPRSS